MVDPSRLYIIAAVDDDPSILESLESLLEAAGYKVLLFSSATELLDSGCLADVDCLISDVGMPLIDGFELSRRAHASRPTLPIILITGHAAIQEQSSRSDLRFQVFRKPLNGHDLLVAIRQGLQEPKSTEG